MSEVDEMSAASRGSVVEPSWKPIADAWGTLSNRMKEDCVFAWAVHCILACPFMDEGGSHKMANLAAARIMANLFGVDVTEYEEWAGLEKRWEADGRLYGLLERLAPPTDDR